MQNAKGTFYTMLQGRLAVLNPSRTIVVRGVARPGTLVEENELPTASVPVDTFRLQWTKLQVNSASPLPQVAMECSIQYATDGTSGQGSMDRGRLLAAMDAELASALAAEPRSEQKMNYSGASVGVAPAAMGTNVFWSDPVFVDPLRAGAPAMTVAQVRAEVEATVSLEFESWGKLQATLASGSQQTNLLTTTSSAAANGSGGTAAVPIPLLTGSGPVSTATALNVGATAALGFSVGSLLAVDIDYTGQLGYLGTGVSTAYVQSAAAVGGDVNYIRRVTLNVGVVVGVDSGVLTLASPLPAGTPTEGMKVSRLVGFCDREGASFFQEWSALFVLEGAQGDRILYHYPRLQAMQGSAEAVGALAAPLESIRLAAAFRALPVKDANDGETVVCFRSYLPAALRNV